MKKIKESKMIYESIKIPEKLEYKVNNALRINKNKSRFYINRVVTVCSSVCLLFILLLNVNPSFANTVNDIPVIGKITSIFTIREYFKEDDSEIINVKEPAIITNNKDVEEKINNIIANKIKDLEKESELSVDEIKKEINYKDRRGSIYPKVNVRIDYEIKYNQNNILSFVLIKEEGINTTSKDLYTYNFNIVYNVKNNTFETREETSVIESKKVLVEALINASSIAGMLLTTTHLIINEEKKFTNSFNEFSEL